MRLRPENRPLSRSCRPRWPLSLRRIETAPCIRGWLRSIGPIGPAFACRPFATAGASRAGICGAPMEHNAGAGARQRSSHKFAKPSRLDGQSGSGSRNDARNHLKLERGKSTRGSFIPGEI